MSNQKSPVRLASAGFLATLLLVFGFGFSLSVPADSSDTPEEVEQPSSDTFSWKPLPIFGPYTVLCTEDPYGLLVCHDSCPVGAICAEFSNDYGLAHTYCCIPPNVVGSTEISDCMVEVQLVRSGPPEEVISPWD